MSESLRQATDDERREATTALIDFISKNKLWFDPPLTEAVDVFTAYAASVSVNADGSAVTDLDPTRLDQAMAAMNKARAEIEATVQRMLGVASRQPA